MTSFPQPLHEHLKYTRTHDFSHCVSDTDWRVIVWLDHLDEGIPERDCYRLATVLPSTLMVTSAGLIEMLDTGSGNYKESKITKGETFSYLDCWWCFGVTDLGRGNKFLRLAFPQENEKLPHLLAVPSTQYPPSFRPLVYIELSKLRIEAQTLKIKILKVKMEHAHLQFWLSTKLADRK